MGAITRGADGKVLVVGIKQAQLRESVSFAEVEAIQWGLQVAKQAAISSLMVETDCKEVVDLLNNIKGSRTEIHCILSYIQSEKREFQHIQFSFVPRICNVHAHALAKFALRNSSATIWFETIPAEVQNVINRVVLVE